jgi:hypothetical protein
MKINIYILVEGMDKPANAPEQVRLVDVPVTDVNTALNLMGSFLNLAQRRGTFSLDESAKIWECLKIFAVNETAPAPAPEPAPAPVPSSDAVSDL